jgi:potassium-transporting ATPase potassium-binding subunit
MASDLLQILIYFVIIVVCTPLIGGYMARVFAGERTLLSPVLIPLERAIYGACASIRAGTSTGPAMRWRCWRPMPSAG